MPRKRKRATICRLFSIIAFWLLFSAMMFSYPKLSQMLMSFVYDKICSNFGDVQRIPGGTLLPMRFIADDCSIALNLQEGACYDAVTSSVDKCPFNIWMKIPNQFRRFRYLSLHLNNA